jgi:hypothetical protein
MNYKFSYFARGEIFTFYPNTNNYHLPLIFGNDIIGIRNSFGHAIHRMFSKKQNVFDLNMVENISILHLSHSILQQETEGFSNFSSSNGSNLFKYQGDLNYEGRCR